VSASTAASPTTTIAAVEARISRWRSFVLPVEVGALGKTQNEPDAIYSDGVVTGYGRIAGRPVCIYAHDKTVYGGSVGVTFGQKVCQVMDMAIKIGCPVIGIQDSGGARIQDAVTSLAMYSEISR